MKYTPSLKYNPRVRLLLLVLIFFFVKYHLQMSILWRGVSLKDKERLLLFFLTCQYYKQYSSRTSSLHKWTWIPMLAKSRCKGHSSPAQTLLRLLGSRKRGCGLAPLLLANSHMHWRLSWGKRGPQNGGVVTTQNGRSHAHNFGFLIIFHTVHN